MSASGSEVGAVSAGVTWYGSVLAQGFVFDERLLGRERLLERLLALWSDGARLARDGARWYLVGLTPRRTDSRTSPGAPLVWREGRWLAGPVEPRDLSVGAVDSVFDVVGGTLRVVELRTLESVHPADLIELEPPTVLTAQPLAPPPSAVIASPPRRPARVPQGGGARRVGEDQRRQQRLLRRVGEGRPVHHVAQPERLHRVAERVGRVAQPRAHLRAHHQQPRARLGLHHEVLRLERLVEPSPRLRGAPGRQRAVRRPLEQRHQRRGAPRTREGEPRLCVDGGPGGDLRERRVEHRVLRSRRAQQPPRRHPRGEPQPEARRRARHEPRAVERLDPLEHPPRRLRGRHAPREHRLQHRRLEVSRKHARRLRHLAGRARQRLERDAQRVGVRHFRVRFDVDLSLVGRQQRVERPEPRHRARESIHQLHQPCDERRRGADSAACRARRRRVEGRGLLGQERRHLERHHRRAALRRLGPVERGQRHRPRARGDEPPGPPAARQPLEHRRRRERSLEQHPLTRREPRGRLVGPRHRRCRAELLRQPRLPRARRAPQHDHARARATEQG
ncbi:MAG: bpX6 domain-containing protein, partial [Myxococcota bacterium]